MAVSPSPGILRGAEGPGWDWETPQPGGRGSRSFLAVEEPRGDRRCRTGGAERAVTDRRLPRELARREAALSGARGWRPSWAPLCLGAGLLRHPSLPFLLPLNERDLGRLGGFRMF